MTRFLKSAAIAATIILGATAANAQSYQIGGVRIANPIDSATWWDGAEFVKGDTVEMNFADPDFWMSIPDPKSHSKLHGAITNPANWAQFLKVQTYANMMDPNVWKKWADVKSYDVLIDPQTYTYWMQPGAFEHLLKSERYAQIANPQAYGTLLDTALNNVGYSFNAPSDLFSPTGWMNSITAVSATPTTQSDS